ncbi:MAG: glycosyltransferase family 2 protein, partial [Kiritimatiellae bacterium]|nr:glycosyltransferase family 2 protein [Kiritimatiellia bacterium]
MINVKVSVVVPVYQVAPYIERCAVSLFEQTLLEMQFIFVDDGTLDES